MQESERKIKARQVTRGFEEENDEILRDSPTCSKESLQLLLIIMATKTWKFIP